MNGLSLANRRLKPEHQLLLLAARSGNAEEFPDELERLLNGTINWGVLIAKAQRHKMLEMLHSCLKLLNYAIPEESLSTLEETSSLTKRVNEKLLAEVVNITETSNRAQIPLIHLKGPTLAANVYRESWLRHHGDLDILVPFEHLTQMLDILRNEQYGPTVIESKKEATWEILYRKEVHKLGWAVTLRQDQRRISIDLHWRLMKYAVLSVPTADIWQARSSFDYRGNNIPVFEPSMNFLYLARHAAKHGWAHLRWIADLIAVTESPGFNFEDLMSVASRYRYRQFVLFALELVRRCPGARMPESIVSSIKGSSEVCRQADFIWERLFVEERDLTEKECLNHLSSLEDTRFKAMRIYADAIAKPTLRDWEESPLALPFFGAYYILRPLRLLKDYGLRSKR